MSYGARVFIAITSTLIIGVAAFVGVFAIELAFEGCCGAPQDPSNDLKLFFSQMLVVGAAIFAAGFILYWGFREGFS